MRFSILDWGHSPCFYLCRGGGRDAGFYLCRGSAVPTWATVCGGNVSAGEA